MPAVFIQPSPVTNSPEANSRVVSSVGSDVRVSDEDEGGGEVAEKDELGGRAGDEEVGCGNEERACGPLCVYEGCVNPTRSRKGAR